MRRNITLPLGSRPREFDMSSTAIVWWSVVAFLSFAVVLLVVGSWYIITKPVDNGVRNLDSAMWCMTRLIWWYTCIQPDELVLQQRV